MKSVRKKLIAEYVWFNLAHLSYGLFYFKDMNDYHIKLKDLVDFKGGFSITHNIRTCFYNKMIKEN